MRKEAGEDLQQLVLRSELCELARVLPWVEALAGRYAFSEKTSYVINLCLEEAISNVVRHGYKGDARHEIVVEFRSSEGELVFTVEDTAPHFRPAESQVTQPASLEELTPGGLGIPLMQRFTDRLEWEPLQSGNRLTLVFANER
jgi:anti-sigma regulatory factor (Ser/Thr protein kinase)